MPFRDRGLVARIDFNKLESHISNQGDYVVHYISALCPCMTQNSVGAVGHADPSCITCYGSGYIYRDPVKIVGLLTALTTNKFWSQVAWISPGDLSFSPSARTRRIGDFDRIQLTSPVPVESQVITRGQATSYSPRPSSLESNEDYLYWESGRSAAAYLEDEDGNVYRPGDYELDGRIIRWPSGSKLLSGKKYTIKYEAYPEYICWSTPIDRWDKGRELGQRVLLRRAVLDSDPTRRQIKPPWEEDIMSVPDRTRDDRYTKHKDFSLKGHVVGGRKGKF